MMKSVVIYQAFLPEYRIPFFNKLIKLGIDSHVTYQIVIAEDRKGQKKVNLESYNQNYVFIPRKTIEFAGREIFIFSEKNFTRNANMIITEYAIRNLKTYQLLIRKRKNLFAFWGHGSTYTKKKSRLEELFKKRLLRYADWFFSYTNGGVSHITHSGFPIERSTIVNNSTDTTALLERISELAQSEIKSFRLKYDLASNNVAIFIGAFDQSKRLEFLIASAVIIGEKLDDFTLLIFGDGPEIPIIKRAIEEYPFIKYGGRANLQVQALSSKIAQIIMMPGRVGLIAVDSFALGLPIVTTNWPWHAPEFEYLVDGVNSKITQDNIDIYSNAVIQLLLDENSLKNMQAKCKEYAAFYSIEVMAKNFHQGVLKALELPLNSKHRKLANDEHPN